MIFVSCVFCDISGLWCETTFDCVTHTQPIGVSRVADCRYLQCYFVWLSTRRACWIPTRGFSVKSLSEWFLKISLCYSVWPALTLHSKTRTDMIASRMITENISFLRFILVPTWKNLCRFTLSGCPAPALEWRQSKLLFLGQMKKFPVIFFRARRKTLLVVTLFWQKMVKRFSLDQDTFHGNPPQQK